MSPVFPFDIVALIIDVVGENKDTKLLKELALVSHSFLKICNKHLFTTIALHDAVPNWRASSKNGFVKLLKSRPDIVKYIRKLTYNVSQNNLHCFHTTLPGELDDLRLSPILPNFLRTIPQLNCLTINASQLDWMALDSPLRSALLHLMHLPTVTHIDLSFIKNFPLSSLTPCINLQRLDILYLEFLRPCEEDDSPEILQLEMPRIRRFYTSDSSTLTKKLLHAKTQDGRPAFDFTDLKQLSMSFTWPEDERNTRYLLQNAKLLEKLHLSVERDRLSLVGLHDILSPTARTLKALELRIPLCDDEPTPLAGLCNELEAMAGRNKLEAMALEIHVDGHETEAVIGSIIQKVEEVLIKPGWSPLKQVSFNISIACCLVSRETSAELSKALQSLPDKYLSHLSKLKSITFNYSASVVKCAYDLS
jgi:hypothetical protein